MSEKKDQEYFSDGLAEELIAQLANAPDLKVIARIRTMAEGTQFEGKALDYIKDAEGDTLRLVQVAEALAGALAAASTSQDCHGIR